MLHKILKTILCILVLILIGLSIFFYGIYFAIDHTKINFETLSSEKIPVSLDGKRIVYFSDIKYKEFMNKERLEKIMKDLEQTHPDILIFGGDVFSNLADTPFDSKDVEEVKSILKNLDAPLGKFAVLGDEDCISSDTKKKISQMLYDCDFEVLDNQNLKIRNGEKESISLIGIEPLINGNPNMDSAFKNISEDEYNILITHCPDLITSNEINLNYLDTIISGHSLGGQIRIPLLGPLTKIEGAQDYDHGKYTINNSTLYVSNGIGTTGMDIRIFSPVEVLVFTLEHKA